MTIALPSTPALFAPAPSRGAEVEALVEAAAARLRSETRTWAEGLRQDAIESAPRIAWWRLVWRGVRVPVHALFYVHARRRLDLCLAGLARDLALVYGAEVDALQAEAAAAMGAPRKAAQLDLWLRRGVLEGEVPWRRRLEATLLHHLDAVREEEVIAALRAAASRLVARLEADAAA